MFANDINIHHSEYIIEETRNKSKDERHLKNAESYKSHFCINECCSNLKNEGLLVFLKRGGKTSELFFKL